MQSEQINDLAAALAKAQSAFTSVAKDKEADAQKYKYKYADLASVLDMVRKPLAENGLALVQRPQWQDGGFVLETRLIHQSGQWIAATWPLPIEAKPQELGSALTYGRRYTVSALLGIAAEEDDDGVAAQAAKPAKARPTKGTPTKQIEVMESRDGSVKTFPATGNGALAAIAAIEQMVEQDPDNWQANRSVALHIAEVSPSLQSAPDAPTIKERVLALDEHTSTVLAAG